METSANNVKVGKWDIEEERKRERGSEKKIHCKNQKLIQRYAKLKEYNEGKKCFEWSKCEFPRWEMRLRTFVPWNNKSAQWQRIEWAQDWRERKNLMNK